MSELQIREIESLYDALDIAAVRNSGREFMTGDTHEIVPTDQMRWYTGTYLAHNRAGVMRAYLGCDNGDAAAYGLLNRRNADWWVTGVITPEHRGKGYGEQMFRHLDDVAFNDIGVERLLLDVREDNHPAIGLYEKLGYEAVLHGGGVIVMELERPHES